MQYFPPTLERLVEQFARLPGVGRKSAQRLAFFVLSLPDEEATTVAGLVIHEARAIPDAGQAFTFHGFRFEVMRKSRNRVTALRITPAGNGATEPSPAA